MKQQVQSDFILIEFWVQPWKFLNLNIYITTILLPFFLYKNKLSKNNKAQIASYQEQF